MRRQAVVVSLPTSNAANVLYPLQWSQDRIASLGWSMISEIDYLPEIWKDVMHDDPGQTGIFDHRVKIWLTILRWCNKTHSIVALDKKFPSEIIIIYRN